MPKRGLALTLFVFFCLGFLSCLLLLVWVHDGTTAALMEGAAPEKTIPVSACPVSQDGGKIMIFNPLCDPML